MNVKKTKTMVISKNDESPQINITIDGDKIQVKTFNYLGHMITDNGKCDDEIKRRIIIAKIAFSKMSKIMVKPQIPLPTRFYTAIYGQH